MCVDFNIHDTGSGKPHAHILLTMRPMDERGEWLPKSKKEYVLDENGERIRLSSGRYKTRKVDLVDWNSQENAEVWRKVWADLANEFLERNNRPERIDHRSYERQDHFVCANYRSNTGSCSAHFIRAVVLEELVWMHMRAVISYVSRYEDHFRAVMEQKLRTSPAKPRSVDTRSGWHRLKSGWESLTACLSAFMRAMWRGASRMKSSL